MRHSVVRLIVDMGSRSRKTRVITANERDCTTSQVYDCQIDLIEAIDFVTFSLLSFTSPEPCFTQQDDLSLVSLWLYLSVLRKLTTFSEQHQSTSSFLLAVSIPAAQSLSLTCLLPHEPLPHTGLLYPRESPVQEQIARKCINNHVPDNLDPWS